MIRPALLTHLNTAAATFAAMLVCCASAATLTTLTGTFTLPNGSPANGKITATAASTWTNADGTITLQKTVSTATVTNGSGSISLYPNDATVEAGTFYTITYSWGGAPETWIVSSSNVPLSVAAVRRTTQPLTIPSVMFLPRRVFDLGGAAGNIGVTYRVIDGATPTDCKIGGGGYSVPCTSNGSSWVPLGAGALASATPNQPCWAMNNPGCSFGITLKPAAAVDGIMIMPSGSGSTPASYWGYGVMNGDQSGYLILGRASSQYQTGGAFPWVSNNGNFLAYGGTSFAIGAGVSSNPNLSFTPGNASVYGNWILQSGSSFLATAATRTAPIKTGTSIPTACGIGDLFFKSDAAPGSNIFGCTSDNIFTQMFGGGGGGGNIASINSLPAAVQTMVATPDTNVGLSITSSIATHTFAIAWSGQLPVVRGGAGAATLSGILKGNGTSAVGAAAYGDVTALFGSGSCSGYLHSSGACLTPSGGDLSSNTSSSVVGEVALFADTSGKLVKRATGSGIAKLTSGVLGTATSGTDYAPATSGTAMLKANGAGGFSSAVSGTDYAPATTGGGILKANGAGGFAAAVSGTDYAPATSGTALLKANGSGAFANAVGGSDYSAPGVSETTSGDRAFTGILNASGASTTKPHRTVASDPSGSCSSANEVILSTASGNLFSCYGGTWHGIGTGVGLVTMLTGSGSPISGSVSCSAPSSSNWTMYTDTSGTAGQNVYACITTNTWARMILVKPSDAFLIAGSTSAIASLSTPSSGTFACVGDSSVNTLQCKDSSGNVYTQIRAGVDVGVNGQVTATHLVSALPIAQGGTGTTSPAFMAGTNVSITGTWPNQTISSSGSGSGPSFLSVGSINDASGWTSYGDWTTNRPDKDTSTLSGGVILTATATYSGGAPGGPRVAGRYTSVSPPYDRVFLVSVNVASNNNSAGVMFTDGTRSATCGVKNAANAFLLSSQYHPDYASSGSSVPLIDKNPRAPTAAANVTPIYFRLSNDSTTRSCYVSFDGYAWLKLTSEAAGTNFTETGIGYFVDNGNDGNPVSITVRGLL